jgi:hypothetical protein
MLLDNIDLDLSVGYDEIGPAARAVLRKKSQGMGAPGQRAVDAAAVSGRRKRD